ncbi:MAG: helix-hairpin-helix domain-containing protein [Clostridia bacterium]|nr:helix-hairpin-helix domain-containing protein [Clostridia bacterium]
MKARRLIASALTILSLSLTALSLALTLSSALPLTGRTSPGLSLQGAGRPYEAAPLSLPSGTIAVNTADLYELTELPGVGETIAQAIIDEREANGPFRMPEDLLSVKGIGIKKLEGFRDWLDMSVP